MSNELNEYGEGSYIDTFVCAGSKNYAMKVIYKRFLFHTSYKKYRFQIFSTEKQDYVTSVKVKGITLNAYSSNSVNFETMEGMVKAFVKDCTQNVITVIQ